MFKIVIFRSEPLKFKAIIPKISYFLAITIIIAPVELDKWSLWVFPPYWELMWFDSLGAVVKYKSLETVVFFLFWLLRGHIAWLEEDLNKIPCLFSPPSPFFFSSPSSRSLPFLRQSFPPSVHNVLMLGAIFSISWLEVAGLCGITS